MQVYVISEELPEDYSLEKGDILFPCFIADLRDGSLKIYESEDSDGRKIGSSDKIDPLENKVNNIEYNIFTAFGAVEIGVLDNEIIGIY